MLEKMTMYLTVKALLWEI